MAGPARVSLEERTERRRGRMHAPLSRMQWAIVLPRALLQAREVAG